MHDRQVVWLLLSKESRYFVLRKGSGELIIEFSETALSLVVGTWLVGGGQLHGLDSGSKPKCSRVVQRDGDWW